MFDRFVHFQSILELSSTPVKVLTGIKGPSHYGKFIADFKPSRQVCQI